MNSLRKVVSNTVISLLGQGITWTSTLVLTIAYGRFLGDVKFGELYFAITFVMLIGFPIEFGFNQQLTRDVAQVPSKALCYLSNILCLKILLWLILYSCILLLCWLLGYSSEVYTLVAISGVTLLMGSIANTMSALHYAFQRVVFPVIGTILEKGLSAAVGFIVLRYGGNVQVVAYVLLGSSCASMLWQAAWVLRLVGISFTINIPLIKELSHKSIPFLVYGVLGVIYYRIDTILLSLMTNDAVVGWYGAGYRIFDTLVFLPSLVISAIMYPIFSKLSVHAEAELKIAVEKSLNFLLFCGIPISTGLIVAAPNLIGFLYHRPEFIHAIPVMQGLAPGLLFLYINSVLTSTMMSTGREKKITIMAGVALVFNLVLNLFLIPRYQHIGAAAVTSLTELLLTVLSMLLMPRTLRPVGSVKVGAKALLAAVVMGTVIWYTRQYNLLVLLPAAAIAYFSAAILLGVIPREDMSALYMSIRHKAGRTHAVSDTEQEEQQLEKVSALANEKTQPDLESVILWSRALTDPALLAYEHELRLPDTPYVLEHDDEVTMPRSQAIELSMNGKVLSIAPVRLPDTPHPVEMQIDDDATIPRTGAIHLSLGKQLVPPDGTHKD